MTTAFILLASMILALVAVLSNSHRVSEETLPDKSKNSPCIMKAPEMQSK